MKQDERAIQNALVQWLNIKRINYFAVVNENQMSFKDKTIACQIGAKSKKQGKKRGVSDLVIFCKDKILFLELKTEKGRQSLEQKGFEAIVGKYDYAIYKVAHSLDEAIKIIEGGK